MIGTGAVKPKARRRFTGDEKLAAIQARFEKAVMRSKRPENIESLKKNLELISGLIGSDRNDETKKAICRAADVGLRVARLTEKYGNISFDSIKGANPSVGPTK